MAVFRKRKKQNSASRIRIDDALISQGYTTDRSSAFALVLTGKVYVNNEKISAASRKISVNDFVNVNWEKPYVSRGGDKLHHALDHFNLAVKGKICIDAGAATGGFTDCLLRNGASYVYAVDTAYGKLDWSLRHDVRVCNLERHNIRCISRIIAPQTADVCVVDISFSSIKSILPLIRPMVKQGGYIVALVKPQFELTPDKLRNGIVRDHSFRMEAVEAVMKAGIEKGLTCRGTCVSAVKGSKGNQEYFILFGVDAL